MQSNPPFHGEPHRRIREDPRRALGRLGEELAATHFERLGYTELARNERTRHGEIDLIVFEPAGRTLVFVEVKTRRAGRSTARLPASVDPLEAIGWRKRRRLRSLASAWLNDADRSRPTARTIRFDAVGVFVDRHGGLLSLEHLEGAW